ncbi:hypothetical protein OUZ56_004108 [Daphnia magna]|uniref:Uncharacterized protein n=1 Tax=Daphnia magna TaxID=35525 RepID=A0ABQ9YNS4_9CRUS|nr:hypothetical protein OUZ56_004108 [Daphnia magna]
MDSQNTSSSQQMNLFCIVNIIVSGILYQRDEFHLFTAAASNATKTGNGMMQHLISTTFLKVVSAEWNPSQQNNQAGWA